MEDLLRFYKALSDPARLRIIRLLDQESLNVGELTRILGLAQSSVSQKLGELRRCGIVKEKREGGFTYYALDRRRESPAMAVVRRELARSPDPEGDRARLLEIIEMRRERGMTRRGMEPGRSWVAWAKALRFVIPPLRVADLGCGDGALTVEMAAWAGEVIAVERDVDRVRRARERFEKQKLRNVRLIHASIEVFELDGPPVDVAFLCHVLHFSSSPDVIVEKAAALLKPGGRVIVLELDVHGEEWVRERLGHVCLGYERTALRGILRGAGLSRIEVDRMPAGAASPPFRILLAAGVKE